MGTNLLTGNQLNVFNEEPEKGWIKRWSGLAIGILVIWLFAAFFIPWWSTLPIVKPLISYIKEYDIKATAIYYTDIEQFSEADHMLQQIMKYPVKKDEKQENHSQ